MTKEMIMIDSPDAATWQTVEGWVSRSGRFFGKNEQAARYDGCTHRYCEGCKTPIPSHGFTKCHACIAKSDAEKFAALPKAEWDGTALLYSEAKGVFYSSPDEAMDCLEEGETMESLRLVICVPQYPRSLDAEYFFDQLPEDFDTLPDDLEEAMDAFNAALEKMQPLSWTPGRTALALGPQSTCSGVQADE